MEFTENKPARAEEMRRELSEDVRRQAAVFAAHLSTLEKSERALRELPFVRGSQAH